MQIHAVLSAVNQPLFKKNHRSVINRCSQPLLSPLDQYFIPWPRKNIAQCMDPCSCSYILFHILLFSTGRHMKTIRLKSLLVFYLFLCKINRTLLDFVVSKVSTLLVPQLIFVCLYGVLLSHPNSIEKNSIICSRNRSRQWQILSKIHAGPLCPFT